MLKAVTPSNSKQRRFILLTLSLVAPYFLSGAGTNHLTFENATINTEGNSIRWIQQDTQGLLWLGTNKGLFSYDGYLAIAHFKTGSPANTLIKCGLFYKQDYLLLGTETGLLMYHHRYDRYEAFE